MMRVDLISPVQPQPRRLRFSVDDYHKMIELGMIDDYEKAEIIDGELVQKMTIGDAHAAAVNALNRFFSRNLPDSILVSVQNPLTLSEFDEPEPDIVLADLTKYDGRRHPRPSEVIIAIEVSDVSLRYDRDVKLPLYAEACIGEVWIVNLPNQVIEIHREPKFGIYQRVDIFASGQAAESRALPDLKIDVSTILS